MLLKKHIFFIMLIFICFACEKQEDSQTTSLLASNLWSLSIDCDGIHHTDEEYFILSIMEYGDYVIYRHEDVTNGIWKLSENEDTLILDGFKYQINLLTEEELELFSMQDQCLLSFKELSATNLTTIGVSSLSKNTAILHGKIRTNHSSINVAFEYGFTTNYGNTTKTISVSGPLLTEFETQVNELLPDTLYHFRVKATNSTNTYYSEDLTFRTFREEMVSDIDGNEYNTVKIGTQIWMVENLKTTKYRNGVSIPHTISDSEWQKLSTGAYCFYENDNNKVERFGRLYNWYAVNNSNNLAPEGWRVATDSDWTILTDYLGGEEIAGDNLKAIEAGGNNSSGFTALMAGNRHFDGPYNYFGSHSSWWCATNSEEEIVWSRTMNYLYGYYKWGDVDRTNFGHKRDGLSVRCVKD